MVASVLHLLYHSQSSIVMSHFMYGSEERCLDTRYSRVFRLHEEDGRVSYVRFRYEWEGTHWLHKYMSVKNEYTRLTHAYQNWDISKKKYMQEIKHAWLEEASIFVEEDSDGYRDLIPLDLRAMIQDARKLVGYPVYYWPAILHVTDNGYGVLVFPVEWDVLGKPCY